ncbi:hypothetical protein HMPREF0762_00879 [Slackia exigua ATCC 700122]|uniref:Uncharacterized protein n=1 Tax=Slackia exigua (strain ATCC 700122 / DSM 15923 / CIP 105133 / JCM 11022 / KCTC 5966 / S-7) TaxID=649764 RepID=D0WGC8_SLAES|nr:hypothetical protein HMPREF0762_00879 [Slackia exigua ATCC 700122]
MRRCPGLPCRLFLPLHKRNISIHRLRFPACMKRRLQNGIVLALSLAECQSSSYASRRQKKCGLNDSRDLLLGDDDHDAGTPQSRLLR